jgi:hypothetical protein
MSCELNPLASHVLMQNVGVVDDHSPGLFHHEQSGRDLQPN